MGEDTAIRKAVAAAGSGGWAGRNIGLIITWLGMIAAFAMAMGEAKTDFKHLSSKVEAMFSEQKEANAERALIRSDIKLVQREVDGVGKLTEAVQEIGKTVTRIETKQDSLSDEVKDVKRSISRHHRPARGSP